MENIEIHDNKRKNYLHADGFCVGDYSRFCCCICSKCLNNGKCVCEKCPCEKK